MQQAYLVGRQVFLIFIYIGLGIVCTKKGILNVKTGRSLSNFTLALVMPLLLIRNYVRPMDEKSLSALGIAFFLAIAFHIIAFLLCMPLIKKRESLRYRIERLGAIFSNCGYMAVPLIRAALGEDGVFYALAFISVFNIFLWSIGIMVLTGERKMEIKKLFLNPGFMGAAIGLILFFTQFPVPAILLEAMDSIIVFNTPLPMITTGIFLANINIWDTFTDRRVYYTVFLRLIALPLVMIVFIKLLNVSSWMPGAHDIILATALGCACPAAAATTLLPARFGLESEYGAKLITMSTLFSIVTLPLITIITNLVI